MIACSPPWTRSPIWPLRDYLARIRRHGVDDLDFDVWEKRYPTLGPGNRFGAILFIEKEGFMPLFKEVRLAERYDLAIMSTKGMSVTAARFLVETLCAELGQQGGHRPGGAPRPEQETARGRNPHPKSPVQGGRTDRHGHAQVRPGDGAVSRGGGMVNNTTSRERLPARRPSATHVIRWAGSDDQPTEYSVTVGYFLDGRPGEVFANGPKVGSAMQALLEDSCVAVSIALQHGVPPEALAHSMGRTPISKSETRPASIIGAIAEVLMQGQAVERAEAKR